MKKCLRNHESECERIGEINRFDKKKSYCCVCYQTTYHKQDFNNNFNEKDYCNNCEF